MILVSESPIGQHAIDSGVNVLGEPKQHAACMADDKRLVDSMGLLQDAVRMDLLAAEELESVRLTLKVAR
ncbi:hypothetical protein NDU88_006047 [Pleurodeles waltl]|uniref:Uncharacterized protein n=1 Tax=Pleurodeles waltl TaxID=8319 RepID=A0AAV7NQT8_PLEWA|nr:hypothetical protein NDU88_006047 [Pleurodeles waltl]